jgi:hypothetical protein
MESNLIALLDAYNAAKGKTDAMWIHSGESDAAESAHQAAIAEEETAIDDAVRELRILEPRLTYNTARAMIAIPAYRERIKAQYKEG